MWKRRHAWEGRERDPDDGPVPATWIPCAEHHVYVSPDGWCPFCYDEAAREARALGETMHGRVATQYAPDGCPVVEEE